MSDVSNALYDCRVNMPGKVYCLYDLAVWKNGLAFKKIDFSEDGVPVIKIAELNNGIGASTAFTNGTYSEEVHLFKGDMLFSWSGNPQTSIDVFWFPLEEGWLNQHIFKVTPYEKIVLKEYFYYLMKSLKNVFTKIASNKQTTGLGHVTIKDLKQIKVTIPELSVQKSIIDVIKPVDDKISNNGEINRNLSEQTEALFQSWFVDLDPWGGEMPVDWKQGVLGDFVTIKRGGSPRPIKEYLSDEGLGWLKISDVTSLQSPFVMQIAEHIKESGLKKTVFLKKGALVLSNSATPGIPKILGVDSCIHDGWLYFPESKLSNEFLYLFFKNIRPKLVALGNGSVFTNLKTDILKGYSFEKPDSDTLREFDELVIPMFDEMRRIARENNKLAELRDSLLPKLMSGELDVSDLNI